LTAAVGAAAALAIAIAVYGRGCESDQDTAEAIARQFLAASLAGDSTAMYELMSKDTREQLASAARRATELVGGSRRYGPTDMIDVSPSAAGTQLPALSVLERGERRVVFDVGATTSHPGATLTVIYEQEAWRVDVPAYQRAIPAPPPGR
jgi:hypothetical protein